MDQVVMIGFIKDIAINCNLIHLLNKQFYCFYCLMDTLLNTGSAAINKTIVSFSLGNFNPMTAIYFWVTSLSLHKETRKSTVATTALFVNMKINYSLFSNLSQRFWAEKILSFLQKRIDNLKSDTTFPLGDL